MKTLIVIDMQNDFITGSLGTKEAKGIVLNVKRKVDEYRNRGDQVIFTKDTHDENYLQTSEGKHLPIEHCIYGTYGWQIFGMINSDGCEQYDKSTFGFTRWNNLMLCNDIEICGVCTDVCVISNVLILKSTYPEKEITVDASCCAGTTPENHKAALTVMKSCQINVIGE